jgi:hypothetical protein
MWRITGFLSAFLLFASAPATSLAESYAPKAAPLRASPSPTAKAVDGVDANQSVGVLESKDSWARVRLGIDVSGWLPEPVLSDTWIKVWKKERKLFLTKDDRAERTFRAALGAQNPTGPDLGKAHPEGAVGRGEGGAE